MISRALVVTDLGYGDSGKGSITDFLVREIDASLVVRYNGGAQAAHRVVRADGRSHIFSQWGSGTFDGARTLLSKHVVIHPTGLVREAEHLLAAGIKDPWSMLLIDERCSVVTPFQVAMNRIREYARGEHRHGSCGIGIGETVEDRFQEYTMTAVDLTDKARLLRKLKLTQDAKIAKAERLDLPKEGKDELAFMKTPQMVEQVADVFYGIGKLTKIISGDYAAHRLRTARNVVFEGAQGVLLDMDWGFYPYNTWSNCTDSNAMAMLEGFDGKVERVGVLRAYATRHGPGPFVSYDKEMTERLPDEANKFHPFQREFRCGWFDMPATKYALKVNKGIDYLAITCIDRLEQMKEWGWCENYKKDGVNYKLVPPPPIPSAKQMMDITQDMMTCRPEVIRVPTTNRSVQEIAISNIQDILEVEVGLTSRGPMFEDKTWEL